MEQTRHMGDVLLGRAQEGARALEDEITHGPAERIHQETGHRRASGGSLPRVRHLAENGEQVQEAVRGARGGRAVGPVAGTQGDSAQDAALGRSAHLGRTQGSPDVGAEEAQGQPRASTRWEGFPLGRCDWRHPGSKWPGSATTETAAIRTHAHHTPPSHGAERRLVHRLQGSVPPWRRDALLSADRHGPIQSLHLGLRRNGSDLRLTGP